MIEGILARRAANGDVDAFDRLSKRIQPDIYHFLLHLTGSVSEAEDLSQSTLIRAHESLADLRNHTAIRGWLFRIAHNEFRRWLKGRSSVEAISSELIDRADIGPDAIILFGAIAELPDELRTAFIAREIVGLSVVESAMALDIPAGTVKSRCFEARSALKRKLANSWPGHLEPKEITNES